MAQETYLTLSQAGFPQWSARGCVQELFPLPTGELRRTVNGVLVYTGSSAHHKYRSIIYCRDKAPVAFESLWRGSEIEVGCIQRLVEKVQGETYSLSRTPIPSSLRVRTAEGADVTAYHLHQRQLTLEAPVRGGFVSYCPLLNMRLLNFHFDTNEWGMTVGWKLWLEEI